MDPPWTEFLAHTAMLHTCLAGTVSLYRLGFVIVGSYPLLQFLVQSRGSQVWLMGLSCFKASMDDGCDILHIPSQSVQLGKVSRSIPV